MHRAASSLHSQTLLVAALRCFQDTCGCDIDRRASKGRAVPRRTALFQACDIAEEAGAPLSCALLGVGGVRVCSNRRACLLEEEIFCNLPAVLSF